jgi:hypothetical protein
MVFTKDRILRGIRLRVCRKIYFDFCPEIDNSILVAGSGRSGTTWLGEIINSRNEFRTIFEPFHPDRVDAWSRYPHRYYIPCLTNDEYILGDALDILSGKIRDRWSATHNTKLWATKRIIKEISMNNSLPYLKTKFPQLKVVFIYRNPFAVAQSRIRLGWHREVDPTVLTDLSVFFNQPILMNDFLHPFADILMDSQLTDLEKEIAFWCAENYIPLNHIEEDAMFLKVSYDKLMQNPLKEFKRVFQFLNLAVPKDLLRVVAIPSTTSTDASKAAAHSKGFNSDGGKCNWILRRFDLAKFLV